MSAYERLGSRELINYNQILTCVGILKICKKKWNDAIQRSRRVAHKYSPSMRVSAWSSVQIPLA